MKNERRMRRWKYRRKTGARHHLPLREDLALLLDCASLDETTTSENAMISIRDRGRGALVARRGVDEGEKGGVVQA